MQLEYNEKKGAEGVEHFDEEVPPQADVGGQVREEETSR